MGLRYIPADRHEVQFRPERYIPADRHEVQFRPEIADYQFTHVSFAKLLSDEEAQHRIVATTE